MQRITSLTKHYPLATFFVLAFVLTWPMNRLIEIINPTTLLSTLLVLPIALLALGPFAAALIVSAITGGKTEVVALLRKLFIWRVGLRWYVVALFLLPTLHFVTIYLTVLLGAPAPTAVSFGTVSGLLQLFTLRLVFPWSSPMIEEPGWRGFALPKMQKRFMSPLNANLLLGLLVTLWHLPLIPSGEYAWIYIPGTMAVTILFGWVYNATGGSVLLTIIMHAAEPVLWVSFTGVDETRAMGLLVLVYVVTATIVVLLAGKNLGLKESTLIQAQPESVIAPA